MSVGIHEHINYYTATSAIKLIESAGLTVIDVQTKTLDIGGGPERELLALWEENPEN